ncbi:MAG: VOC family protein, partial [Pseudomonadota bacterium]
LGATTQSAYIVLPEVDSICERARAAGANIVMPAKDEDYGGRVFSCIDPEGHLWNFGTYNPWDAAG